MHIYFIDKEKASTKIMLNVEFHCRAYWCSFYDSFHFSVLNFQNPMLERKTALVLSFPQSLF